MDRLTDRLDMTIVVDWDVKQHSNKKLTNRLKSDYLLSFHETRGPSFIETVEVT